MAKSSKTRGSDGARGSNAFLLAQIGAHAAGLFARRIEALGVEPPDAGVLRLISHQPGLSQRALGETLGISASRLVGLLDRLEERGLVERRDQEEDRRSYALHLTAAGQAMLGEIGMQARLHDDAICASLSTAERRRLGELLRRVADEQGLTPGVHPGFRRM